MTDDAPKKPLKLAHVCLLAGAVVTSALVVLSDQWWGLIGFVICIIALSGRRLWLGALLALNPFTLAAAWAVITYSGGTATLWDRGRISFQPLDHVTRLESQGGHFGCLAVAREELTSSVHDAALSACTRMFGIMRGAPGGPYPQRREMLSGWEGAEALPVRDVIVGDITVSGEKREIPHAGRLLDLVIPGGTGLDDDPQKLAHVKVLTRDFGGGTFALRLTYSFDSIRDCFEAVVLYGGSPVRVLDTVAVPGTNGMAQSAQYVLR